MPTILDKIKEQTIADVVKRKKKIAFSDFDSFERFEAQRIDFRQSLIKKNEVSIIAEVKKASPSKGIIREDFNAADIAEKYEEGGASAISVLTDEPFFRGSLQYLEEVSKCVHIPVLRKDFIIDPYQVKEARAFGADAVLIIVSITEGNQLSELLFAAKEFGLQALVECYDQDDFNRIDFNQVDILGVNNRDLNTFEVDLHRGVDILKQAPGDTVLVSESGLSTPKDLKFLQQNNIHAALIGEYFMKQQHFGKAVSELLKASKGKTGAND